MHQPVRLLIADEAQLGSCPLRTCLTKTQEIKIVGEACTAEATLDKVTLYQPDVLLFNPRLARRNGVQVLAAIHACAPSTRILLFAEDWASCLYKAAPLRGAAGYLLKSSRVEEVRMAIHIIHRGGNVVPFVLIRTQLQKYRNQPSPFGLLLQRLISWCSLHCGYGLRLDAGDFGGEEREAAGGRAVAGKRGD